MPEPLLAPHRTIRTFRPAPVEEALFARLISEAQQAPTDATAQMYAFIRIVDPSLRVRLASLAGDQPHVAAAAEFLVICADVRRLELVLARRGLALGHFPAAALHFATVDASLAAQRLIDAAEAAGLGTCCVGGLLNAIEEISASLALPVGVVPLFGLCLGWPDEVPVRRPRIGRERVVHVDRYREPTQGELDADIAAMVAITRTGDWVKVLASYFAGGGSMEDREVPLRRLLVRQGFAWGGDAKPRCDGSLTGSG